MFPFPHLKYAPIAHIDDDLNAFIEYFLAINEAIDAVLDPNIGNMGSCPFQVDLWIIPKNVESAVTAANAIDENKDVDEDDDDDDDEVGIDVIGNIEHRLKRAKWEYKACPMERGKGKDSAKGGALKRVFQQNLQRIINNERDKRIVIYIDRRNPKYVVTEEKCDEYISKMVQQHDHSEAAKMKR